MKLRGRANKLCETEHIPQTKLIQLFDSKNSTEDVQEKTEHSLPMTQRGRANKLTDSTLTPNQRKATYY